MVTVNVMDLGRDEMLNPAYVEGGVPRRIFVLENDNCWTIYLNVKWLTPRAVQRVLDEFGGIVGRRFIFRPNRLPVNLARKYRKAAERRRGEIERERARGGFKSGNEFLMRFKKRGTQWVIQHQVKPIIAPKRMIEISTHKLKF